jgi:hypothetical protein
MRKLYDKQAGISTFAIIILAFIYQQTGSSIALGLLILFVGALLQSIYDMYKQDKEI